MCSLRAAVAILALIVAALIAPRSARADEATCSTSNVLEHARLTRWLDTTRATALLTDGAIVPEGTPRTSQAVLFRTPQASLTFDLGEVATIGAVFVQGDADASFVLLLSEDGTSWRRVTIGPVPGATGMRARSSPIEPVAVRFVRFGEPSAAGAAVAEVALRCRAPESLALRILARDPEGYAPRSPDWAARVWTSITGMPSLTPLQALEAKLALSIIALMVLFARARLRRAGRVLLLLAGFTALAGYYDWGAFRFPDYVHTHELFHYVVGGKYFQELGYTGLYDCASAVDLEQGFRARVEARSVRDLSTNDVRDGKSTVSVAGECKRRFAPDRWRSFANDVAWFRDHMEPDAWDHVLRDHGFNAPPAWTMVGGSLANLAPASRRFVGYADSMTGGLLAALDPALLALALVALAWAFGWGAACVAAIVFGCNPLASFFWTGGAYLRQDWLALSVIGVACLKKRRFALGGASLGYAALLRVFPVFFLVPMGLRLGWIAWKERRIDRDLARVLLGAAAAAFVVVVVSSAVMGGPRAWIAFAHNTAKLAASPSVNLVGWKTLLSFRPSTRADLLWDPALSDPFARVVAARSANAAQMAPLFFASAAAFLVAVGWAAKRTRSPWVLACVGAATVPVFVELSCYYTSALVIVALSSIGRPRIAIAVVGACAALLALHLALDNDVLYACASAVLVALAVWTVWEHGRSIVRPEGPPLGGPVPRKVGLAMLAVAGALGLLSCASRDPLLVKDGVCEERWATFESALEARAALGGDAAAAARRHAALVHLAPPDFTDGAKVAAFSRAQGELRDALAIGDSAELEAADRRVDEARTRYDDAVADFDAALDRAEVPAINRANGSLFRRRAPLSQRP